MTEEGKFKRRLFEEYVRSTKDAFQAAEMLSFIDSIPREVLNYYRHGVPWDSLYDIDRSLAILCVAYNYSYEDDRRRYIEEYEHFITDDEVQWLLKKAGYEDGK